MYKSPLLVAALVALSLLAVVLSTGDPPAAETGADTTATAPEAPRRAPAGALDATRFPPFRSALRGDPAAAPRILPAGFPAALDPVAFTLDLPGGRSAHCVVEQRSLAPNGDLSMVEGHVTTPFQGRFLFQRQPAGALPGPVFGFLYFPGKPFAYKAETAPAGHSVLVHRPADAVACVAYSPPVDGEPEEIPADHPADVPIPAYQNGVVPLQSLPGAPGVIYLDFDGEEGPHNGWGDFDAVSHNSSNSQIRRVWERVAEDFTPFNLNVTTDLQVFLDAPETSRQRCIVTPTKDAAPSAGGVAYIGSFNSAADTPCWAFYGSGKSSAEVISHEIGHTLRLRHDGRNDPSEEYYGGHGGGDTGWAPIMGVGYSKNVTQWSKGDYLSASNTEDDLDKITEQNNLIDYRPDDHEGNHSGASPIDFNTSGSIDDEGFIGQSDDVDSFLFTTTTGGVINLSIDPVAHGPNLDLLAEIHDASGTVLDSHNPDLSLDATLTTELQAGTYTLRITNTGRGTNASDGYTRYATLGAYTIGGSIPGAVLPDQFTIAEHSPDATLVGNVAPRAEHGAATLTWSIEAGDPLGLFAIDPASGDLTVANSALLDLEALSDGWNDPALSDLTVTIDDPLDPQLDETIRVLVTVTDVNEAPSLTGASLTMLEHTRPGRRLLTLTGRDPDSFDLLTYAITAGDPNGNFSIDNTGVLSPANDLDASVQSVYNLTITASDSGSPPLTASAAVTVNVLDTEEGHEPGGLFHTFYRGISGNNISDLTSTSVFPLAPSDEDFRDEVHADGDGDNYGRTTRAYLIPPLTGDYTFYIAGDDGCELWLSSDADPANATVIAAFSGYTSYQTWTRYTGQKSAAVSLVAGTAYYLEARQKEGGGGDHLSLAWEVDDPSGGELLPLEPIPGLFLAPHTLNYRPTLADQGTTLRANAFAGSPVATMTVEDLNPADTHSFAITSGNPAGAFAIEATTGQMRIADTSAFAAASPHVLTITATDSGTPVLTGTGTLTVTVASADTITAAGPILEIWDGVGGTSLSSLIDDPRFPDRPDRLVELDGLDSGKNLGDGYGARVRATLTPSSGDDYVFYIASDDNGSLLLGSDASAANATEIATVPGWTSYKVWNKFPDDQASTPVNLVAGEPRFIEARFKEGGGGDHVAVGWTNSSITSIALVEPDQLAPYDSNVAPDLRPLAPVIDLPASPAPGTAVASFTATDSPFEDITFAILAGNPDGAFSINAGTGVLTLNQPETLGPGPYTLEIAAQDSGHGGYFPLRSTTTTATVFLDDSDHDHLPDSWEMAQIGNLDSNGADDDDGDGESNYTAFLFQSDPSDADSLPAVPRANGIATPASGGGHTFQFTFTVRRKLPADAYVLQGSSDLSSWTTLSPGPDVVLVSVTPLDANFETHLLEVTVPNETLFLRAAVTSP